MKYDLCTPYQHLVIALVLGHYLISVFFHPFVQERIIETNHTEGKQVDMLVVNSLCDLPWAHPLVGE